MRKVFGTAFVLNVESQNVL